MDAITVDVRPRTLDDSTETFTRRRTGNATFSFTTLDEELATEFEAFLAPLYVPYRDHHVGGGTTWKPVR